MERLVALLKEKGKTNCPEFYDMEGYMLSEADTEREFHLIMEEIKIHRDRNLADSIPRGLNVLEHYWCNHSFFVEGRKTRCWTTV